MTISELILSVFLIGERYVLKFVFCALNLTHPLLSPD
jgi:hypothetical protein